MLSCLCVLLVFVYVFGCWLVSVFIHVFVGLSMYVFSCQLTFVFLVLGVKVGVYLFIRWLVYLLMD